MPKPAYTLLLIQSGQIGRADFDDAPTPALIKCWRQPRPELSLPELTEVAIKLGPACGKKVYLLCEDLWTQVIAFPVAAVSGLDDVQLLRSCAFESEPLSGIPGMEAVMGISAAEKSDELRTFWFSSMLTTQRDQIQQTVRRNGGSLAGVLHPGGACAPLIPVQGAQPWSRVEVWKQSTVCLSGVGHSRTKLQVINASSAQKRVQASVTSWMVGVDVKSSELLDGEGKPDRQVSQSSTGSRPLTLLADADLTAWFKAWMATLTLPFPPVPMIPAAILPTPRSTYVLAGVAMEIVVLALCLLHSTMLRSQVQKLSSDSAELKKSIDRVNDLDKKAREMDAETAKLVDSNTKTQQIQTVMQRDVVRKRERVALILKSVAAVRPDDVVVEKIKADGEDAQIEGFALRPGAPDDFVVRLEPTFKPLGLVVYSRGTEAAPPDEDDDTWAFSLGISPEKRAEVPHPAVPIRRIRRAH